METIVIDKKYLVLVVFSIILIVPCCDECREDKSFTKLFESSLKTIQTAYEESMDEVTEEEMERSFFFMSKITGHSSSRVAGHFGVIYHAPEDYHHDIKTWKSWYKHNKCAFNMRKADSIFQTLPKSIREEYGNWEIYLSNEPDLSKE